MSKNNNKKAADEVKKDKAVTNKKPLTKKAPKPKKETVTKNDLPKNRKATAKKKEPKSNLKQAEKKASPKEAEKATSELAAATAAKAPEKAAETPKKEKISIADKFKNKLKKQPSPKKEEAAKEEAKTSTAAETAETEAPKAKEKALKKQKEPLTPMSFSKELKERLFSENPVFVKFIAAIPILGAATCLKNGILISAVFVLTVVFLNMIMYPLSKIVPKRFRYPCEILVATILLTPQLMAAMHFLPTVTGLCEFYLPLTALCAVPFVTTTYVGKKHGFGRTVLMSLLDGAGFTFAALLFSLLREIIGTGMLYERPMPYGAEAKFPFVIYPAGAFILLGFLAALFRKIFSVKDKKKGEE